MKNNKGKSSGTVLAAMLAFNFKSKLTLADNGMATKKSLLKGIFVSSEAITFDRERRQCCQKLILALKETLEELGKIKESLGDSKQSFKIDPVTSRGTPEVFPLGLSRTVNTQSFADLAALTQYIKTPLTSGRRKVVQRISKSKLRTRCPPLVLERGQYYDKNHFNVHLKQRNEILQPGIKLINVRLSEVRRILSSLDCSGYQDMLMDLPIRLKFCWEGLTDENEASKPAIKIGPISSSIVVNNSSEFFDNTEDLPMVEEGLDMTNESTNGELWATINSSFLDSEQVTPTSVNRALIQGCSTNSKKSLKRKKFNNGFIATTAKRLFSTSSPLSVMKHRQGISAAQRNFELQYEEIDNSTQISEDHSPMDTSLLESPSVKTAQSTPQPEFITQSSKSTLEVGVQTDFMEVSSLKEESIYDQTPQIPELNKVGLIVGNVPDAFKKLQTVVNILEPYGVVENISIKEKNGWIGFFACYELQESNEVALLSFGEKPFGKGYLRHFVHAKLGTYQEFVQSSHKANESLEFVNVLLKMNHENGDVDKESHLLQKVDELFSSLPIDVSMESISRLFSIFKEEKKSMAKHLVYKVEAIILREARRRVRFQRPVWSKESSVVSTSAFWQHTLERLRELFVQRFRRNPVEIIDLLPIIGDLDTISKFLNSLQQNLDTASPSNMNLQPVYANIAEICSKNLPASGDVLAKMCDTLIIHLRRYAADTWAADLIKAFGSTDHLKRVCSVFEFKIENLTREGLCPLLDCTLIFCNLSNDRLCDGFASILEGLLNIEALTYKQVESIFTCKLAQGSFETFCRLVSALMEKLSSNKIALEKWILIARTMPQWVGSNEFSKERRNLLTTSAKKIVSMLEEVSATYRVKPVQENWARETRHLDAWRQVNQHYSCPGCLELRDFLRDPVQISSNITVNDAGRRCVKKILSSSIDGSTTTTLASHLNLVFEELDHSQNMKLYNSRRCGAIDVRKNPLTSAQSQFCLQWFNDAKIEIQAIVREIEQTPQMSEEYIWFD